MILIDDREGSRDLRVAGSTMVRLGSGDVAFSGNGPAGTVSVGIEVKKLPDLVSSINTGRLLGTQAPAMVGEYDVRWLLIIGMYSRANDAVCDLSNPPKMFRLGNRMVLYDYIESALMTLISSGFSVKTVKNKSEANRWIELLYRWWSKPWDHHRGFSTFDESASIAGLNVKPDVLLRAKVASRLPGLGYKRAMAAAKHFDSILDMMNADRREWEKVEGVGRGVSKSVVDAIRGDR